ncbi:MAG: hypothetical protein MRZ75_05745 [Roseburia sp.]|uniref:hypothetical protein n=1 Tax=Roseburia sp. 831b TaxID=1261635 RepID=UPI00156B09EA|nr:hypothetical protein [Roseburia sp. 831b]MCI5918819.1 hypothetical protein [Roseburia sp.]MDD6215239.1 hypothetical protein [Roseburia sp.]MDY5884553.1 hypothetical protein [Roseburia sp.]WVK73118.1 hypothetical protein BIV16_00935 [Roseburia sp. 831b]
MAKLNDNQLFQLKLEILRLERKNLRSKAKTEQRMSDEIQKIIVEYSKMVRD